MSRSFTLYVLILVVAFAVAAIVAQPATTGTTTTTAATGNTTTATTAATGNTTTTTTTSAATGNTTTATTAATGNTTTTTTTSAATGNTTTTTTTAATGNTTTTTSAATGNTTTASSSTTGNTTTTTAPATTGNATTTTANATTTAPTTTTNATITSGTTAEYVIPCKLANDSIFCPQLAGIKRPETGAFSTEPDDRYLFLQNRSCMLCPKNFLIGQEFICSVVAIEYFSSCPENIDLGPFDLPCQEEGNKLNAACIRNGGNDTVEDSVYNKTILTFWPIAQRPTAGQTGKPTNCLQFGFGKTVCGQKAFLLRKTAGAPNWVWIFIVGVGGFILLVIVIGLIIFCIPKYWWGEYINPCRWCECCPGYYDI